MLKEDRKTHVLRQLMRTSSISVSELSETFHLSAVSVRKLLADMESEGSIQRIWGGAMLASGPIDMPPRSEHTPCTQHAHEKEAIAKTAYASIQDGETIFLNGNTPILHRLATLLANGDKRRVMICTNALPLAFEFRNAEDMQLVFIGGQLRHASLSCIGGAARQMLEKLSFDKCFLTACHFSVERGFTTDSLQEAEVKRTLLSTAKESYFLMDYGTYGTDALSLIAPCEPGKRLIVDWRIPIEVITRLEAAGLQVILARQNEYLT